MSLTPYYSYRAKYNDIIVFRPQAQYNYIETVRIVRPKYASFSI